MNGGGSCTNYQNNSDAQEENRQEFNNSLETIAYNKAYAGTTSSSSSKELVYEKSGHESKLTWGPSYTDPSDRTTTMKAYIRSIYPTKDYNESSKPYLQYLNLGLKIRSEEGDLTLTKDVYKAEVTVNGYQTIYTYDSLGTGNYTATSNYTVSNPYTLRIYREDYEFRTSNYGDLASAVSANNPYTSYSRDNDLNIIITYKITITNNSNSSDAVVREILDYSSNTMTPLYACMDSFDGASLDLSTTSSFNQETSYGTDGYNTRFIQGSNLTGRRVSRGGSFDIYIAYKVNKNSSGYIEKDSTSSLGKVNVAEISAYSLYNQGTSTPTGIVDKNSNPANTLDPSKTSEYEDDTFRTSLQVLLRDEDGRGDRSESDYRIITGTVWEDMNGSSVTEDGQVVGTGYFDKGDIIADNVLVKLYEIITANGTEYAVDTGLWCRVDSTSENDYYQFGNSMDYDATTGKPTKASNVNESTDDCYRLHAGRYVVRFIYGDEADYLTTDSTGTTIRYSGQDYKSVRYTEIGTDSKDAEDEVLKASSFDDYTKNNGNKKYSFAKDNEARRLEVTAYSTTMTYTMDSVLKATSSSEKEILAANTSMYADTKKFDVDIEYYNNYSSDSNLGKYINKSSITKDDHVMKLSESMSSYYVGNINFGLIERPITKLQLMNDITEIVAKTSDGNTILDMFFDITYTKNSDGTISHVAEVNKEKTVGYDKVQVLNRNGVNQGFRYVNIDSDLLQGMTIMLKFRIAIANNSEIDHITTRLDELVKNSRIDLSVDYNGVTSTSSIRNGNKLIETLLTDGTTRTYDYTASELYAKVQDLKTSSPTEIYRYSNGSVYNGNRIGSDATSTSYTYTNLHKQDSNYYVGYYMGDIYYRGETTSVYTGEDDVRVETRVDQYIDYIDPDLIFKAEENVNDQGEVTHLTYSAGEIASKGLMKDITSSTTTITDGNQAYYDANENVNNNLAFNIEDESLNPNLYRYLYTSTDYSGDLSDNLYYIDVEASRTLSSEEDLDGVSVDNLAEIVKVSNTAGRKVYVSSGNTSVSGIVSYIGNSATEVAKLHDPNSSTSIVTIASKETDTDFTEYVTFSPPTGLSKVELVKFEWTSNLTKITAIIGLLIIVVSGVTYVIAQFKKSKKFYK
jgi:hypothetical protein